MLDRLKTLMEYYQLTPSAFADSLGIPRSSISHLLSGRNKPSLDFVLKLIQEYPEVNLYWLLIGKGEFRSDLIATATAATDPPVLYEEAGDSTSTRAIVPDGERKDDPEKELVRVVLFYGDGTFRSYDPKK